MGWWDTGHHDDIVGDRPVEIIGHTLSELADTFLRQEQRKPTLMEILNSVAEAIRLEPREFLLAQDLPAIRPAGSPPEVAASAPSTAREGEENHELRQALRGGFIGVARAYAEEHGRKPRLSELMACLNTVLETRADLFHTDAEMLAPEDVCLEVGLEGPLPGEVDHPSTAPGPEQGPPAPASTSGDRGDCRS